MNGHFDHEERSAILQKLDWRLRFRDSQLQEEFFQFCRRNKLVFMLKVSVIVCGFILLLSGVFTFFYNQSPGEWLFSWFMLFFGMVSALGGCYVIYDSTRPRADNAATEKRNLQQVAIIQVSHYTAFYIWNTLVTYRSFFFEDCSAFPETSRNYLIGWHCNFNSTNIPLYQMSVIVILPIIIIVVLNEIHIDFVVGGFFLNMTSFIAYSWYANNITYVWSGAWMLIAIIMISIELHLFRVGNFLSHRKLRETLLENERMHAESKATELRHMIGNLAHDLKTPLSSFMVGMDMIEHAVQNLENLCTRQEKTTKETEKECGDMMQNIGLIKQCFKNVHNTHAFMLMTINRCIDYTKASKGLKLSPKYDTIDLMETLHMPLACMSNIQEKIKIELLPIAGEICSHIITDKQWLQENVLCLLSNAVKYSAAGTVTIRMCLQEVNAAEEAQESSAELVEEEREEKEDDLDSSKHSYSLPSFLPPLRMTSILFDTTASMGSTPQIHPTNSTTADVQPPLLLQRSFLQQYAHTSCKHRLRFEVEDHGIGLDEEGMQGLFNPFQRAQRLAGGTGLGLYSLAMRMEALKGKYGVQHRLDGQQGSLFWFAIPYRPDNVTASMNTNNNNNTSTSNSSTNTFQMVYTPVKSSQSELITSTFHGTPGQAPVIPPTDHNHNYNNNNNSNNNSNNNNSNGMGSYIPPPLLTTSSSASTSASVFRVLVVDDSPAIVKMVAMMLRLKGHTVTSADNGSVALTLLQQAFFDVILMDLQMPVMDGLETTRRIRYLEQQQQQQTPAAACCHHQLIIGMSANSDHETMEASFFAGMDDFMVKPFHMDAFLLMVRKYLLPAAVPTVPTVPTATV